MTCEQVIVDGVIVSRCANYCSTEQKNGHVFKDVCRMSLFGFCEGKYCKFKFLEITKQLECKNKECNALKNIINDNESYIDQLKEDYEKTKESRDYYKRIAESCPETCEVALCHIDFYNKKLFKALTDIKEIAEPFCNACQEHEPEKRGRDCMYCNYGKILQKIKECEVKNAG